MKSRSIFNKKFLSYAGTMALYGSITLAIIVWMLRKTKFYLTPFQISKVKNYDPNQSFFYDPFVIFASLILLNLSFSLLNNSKYIFRSNFFKNISFYFYISLLIILSLNIIFVYELYHGSTQLFWVNLFRIPEIFGFEYLILFFAVIFIVCFFLVRYIEKKWIRDYIKNFGKK